MKVIKNSVIVLLIFIFAYGLADFCFRVLYPRYTENILNNALASILFFILIRFPLIWSASKSAVNRYWGLAIPFQTNQWLPLALGILAGIQSGDSCYQDGFC